MKPVLSVVGPVFNEELSLPRFHERLMAVLRGLGPPFEVIYVDDGSRDGTPAILQSLRRADPEVKVVELSRNFGHQLAITAGMDRAGGDACVIIDVDGQDPPELIARMLELWREGNEIVYAVRTRREGDSLFKRLTASLFYRLMRRITRVDLPVDAGDFRLVDRKVLDVLGGIRETHRFMRGLTAWVGFRQTRVEYERRSRISGDSHYPPWKMIRFALDAVTSFSHEPLRWVALSGLGSLALSAGIAAWVLYVKIFNPAAVRGWTSLMVAVLFLGGTQLIALGVIGEYLAGIFDEVKRRPLYVVRSAEGFEPRP